MVSPSNVSLPNRVDWSYISGFFDGEGGILVNYGASRRVVRIAFSMAQKSSEVLDVIETFLRVRGFNPTRGTQTDGTHHLRLNRAGEMIMMAAKMKLIVKRRQVQAASDYLQGRISGNQFLEILNDEFLTGRRKSKIPELALVKFPMTRIEARKFALENASAAASAASRRRRENRLMEAFAILPATFTSADLMERLEIDRGAALKAGRLLSRLGLVSIERIRRPGRPMLRFTKTATRIQAKHVGL